MVQSVSTEFTRQVEGLQEMTKDGLGDMKIAAANYYKIIKSNTKRLEAVETNLREVLKAQKVQNALIQDLGKKIDSGFQAGGGFSDDSGLMQEPNIYCSYCDAPVHDLVDCPEKRMCLRCGDYSHKFDDCAWKERQCVKCKIVGHRVEMHDVTSAKVQEELISTFKGQFSHFLSERFGDQGHGRGRVGQVFGRGGNNRRHVGDGGRGGYRGRGGYTHGGVY